MASPSWKHYGSAFVIVLAMSLAGISQPPEKRILGSFFTMDALVFLFTVFAVMFSNKMDQLISAVKQANKNNNND